MPQIHVTHPDLHKHVMNEPYVIRRNDRFWAVYSTDLAIEEDLMRSLKASGGLTSSTYFQLEDFFPVDMHRFSFLIRLNSAL